MDQSELNELGITRLLSDWNKGDVNIQNDLVEKLYPYIHRIAHIQKNKTPSSLQTTEIVNEAFIKLLKKSDLHDIEKNHLIAITTKIIRAIIIDQYRADHSDKRGGKLNHLTIDRLSNYIVDDKNISIDLLELNNLLAELEKIDQKSAQMVELRFFGGFSMNEIAKIMNISTSTISRNWLFAKSWLLTHLT